MKWSIVYEGAYRDDGSLYFPEKISKEFLEQTRRTQGVYIFSNQYLNKTIPDDEQDFKQAWIKKYVTLPNTELYTFAFIDPAISLSDGADYTATVVVKVDCDKNWYVTMAKRQRIPAPEQVKWIFRLYEETRAQAIGIEDVAYQASLVQFTAEEMLRRNTIIPIKGIKRSSFTTDGNKKSNNSKPARIRSLMPRFEFGKIFFAEGLDDLLLEYKAFPRGAHDDLLDALSSIDEIAFYPDKPKEVNLVRTPSDPGYERAYIKQLQKRASSKQNYDD